MSHAVLALGAAAVTASGCVWYLPALADLRAGADRPLSHHRAAVTCLSGWATTGVVAVLLLVAEAWWIPSAAAAAGAAVTVGFRIRAAEQRRRESRETARHWARLRLRQSPPDTGRGRCVVAALIGFGLAAAAATTAWRVAAGPEDGGDWLVIATVPAGVVALFLALAIVSARRAR